MFRSYVYHAQHLFHCASMLTICFTNYIFSMCTQNGRGLNRMWLKLEADVCRNEWPLLI